MKRLLTVFTPTFNRINLIGRGYKALCNQKNHNFNWLIIDDGSTDGTEELVRSWISDETYQECDGGFVGNSKDAQWLNIRYCYKENGGLHTGYNKAIELMDSEICVCIDSDDYMPHDAVNHIVNFWKKNRDSKLAGFIGLDFYDGKNEPIGGYFPMCNHSIHLLDLESKLHHYGDTKMVIRVDVFKEVAPQPSFKGEKNFNPIYMIMLIDQKYKFLTINENLCYVDYQENGMAANIYKQYVNSPNSFAAMRLVAMKQPNASLIFIIKQYIHYVSEKLLAGKYKSLFNEDTSPLLVLLSLIPGFLLSYFIKYKSQK